jgi:hypothetical protein
MPIFISYSHTDKGFVDKLAYQLISRKVSVWLDRWELHAGDSLLQRVQGAISGASGLLVILSKASVQSEWCRKELNAGLVRELDEKRVVAVPVLLEDCDVPLFLRDKIYADFRHDFDDGLRTVMEAVARVTTPSQSRIEAHDWHTDWAIDWGSITDPKSKTKMADVRLTLIEHANDQPYSGLTIVQLLLNSGSSQRYFRMENAGRGDEARLEIVAAVVDAVHKGLDLSIVLEDKFPRELNLPVEDSILGTILVTITARRVGDDTGRDVLLHIGQQLDQICGHMQDVLRVAH